MSTHHDELEKELGRDLHRQVDGLGVVPFGLDEVKGRAGRIRRNRRISAGVAVAAALAVMVPVGLLAGGTGQDGDEIRPAPSPSVPVEVSRTTLTLAGIARGDAPAVEYFTPDGVVLPDGGTQPLTESYQALVPGSGGGWIALGAGRDEVLFLSEDLEPQGAPLAVNGFAATPPRDLVAWTEPGSQGQTLTVRSTADPDDAMTWDLAEGPVAEPVGILGPDSVVYETVDQQGRTEVGLATPDGLRITVPFLRAFATDPVNGLVSVQTESSLTSGCFAVIEAATLAAAWETCDYKLGSFSPDGAYVMATDAEADGLGPTTLHLLDARTGELVADFSSRGPTPVVLLRPSWESADTVVATAMQGNTITMVRMGVDGTLEETVDPVEGSAYDDVYYYLGEDRVGL